LPNIGFGPIESYIIDFDRSKSYIWQQLLCLTPLTAGFPSVDLRKIFRGCQWMTKVPNRPIAENFNRLSRAHERYRRQTNDRWRTTDRRTGDSI